MSEILQQKLEKCDEKTKQLFYKLIDECTNYCTSHCSVNMKEFHYRFQKCYNNVKGKKIQNFCLFTLTPSKCGLTIHLRTDGATLKSDTIDIDKIPHISYLSGNGWIKFSINNIDDINEAVRLIETIYKSS